MRKKERRKEKRIENGRNLRKIIQKTKSEKALENVKVRKVRKQKKKELFEIDRVEFEFVQNQIMGRKQISGLFYSVKFIIEFQRLYGN